MPAGATNTESPRVRRPHVIVFMVFKLVAQVGKEDRRDTQLVIAGGQKGRLPKKQRFSRAETFNIQRRPRQRKALVMKSMDAVLPYTGIPALVFSTLTVQQCNCCNPTQAGARARSRKFQEGTLLAPRSRPRSSGRLGTALG